MIDVKNVAGTDMINALGHATTSRIKLLYSQVLKSAPNNIGGTEAVTTAINITTGT